MAVPNVSEGATYTSRPSRRASPRPDSDLHSDPDHDRSVFTLAGRRLAAALDGGATAEHIDISAHAAFIRTGALDVPGGLPGRGASRRRLRRGLTAAAMIGEELAVPVFLYGELATRPEHAERAWIRRGGSGRAGAAHEGGELAPDYGPKGPPDRRRRAGGAAPRWWPSTWTWPARTWSSRGDRRQAARVRRRLPGVRALGLYLEDRERAQVSTNVHDHRAVPLREIVNRVRR